MHDIQLTLEYIRFFSAVKDFLTCQIWPLIELNTHMWVHCTINVHLKVIIAIVVVDWGYRPFSSPLTATEKYCHCRTMLQCRWPPAFAECAQVKAGSWSAARGHHELASLAAMRDEADLTGGQLRLLTGERRAFDEACTRWWGWKPVTRRPRAATSVASGAAVA